MKIIVLDGFTLNPGDISWAELQALGDCEIFDRTPPADIMPRAARAEILLTNKVELMRAQLQALSNLRYIGVTATGTNVVDLPAARERNILVTNVPAYGTRSVAQTTIALLLELTQHVGHHAQTVRESRWAHSSDWCYWDKPLIELDGLVLGIVGYGRIGQAVSALGRALGMTVLAYTQKMHRESSFATFVDLETLFRKSDVVSLHCPLSAETKELVNAKRLASMKPTAFLLNTSRGQLIDELALADALDSGKIAGAGLDVLSKEPPPQDHPLLRAKNCLITPHLAWATRSARLRLMKIAVENVRAFISGNPQNVVN